MRLKSSATGARLRFGTGPWRALAALALAVALALAWPDSAQAQGADPRVPWFSADSAHFRVHYREGQRAQAEAVARAAERIYPRVTQSLQWWPRGRTEVMVYSEFDVANGFFTPLPFNKIGIFLTPPDAGELLDNSAWLDLVLVHEFTHAVHLDKVRGAPQVLQRIFGRLLWWLPNLFQPGWMLEGLAVWHESAPDAGRGRLKGPLFEAWLRAERQSGFLPLAELNAAGRALPLSKQYLYGAYFFEFLDRRYGPDKTLALVERYSGNVAPRLHSAPWAATGKTMDALWDEFRADLQQQVGERAAAVESLPERTGARLLGPLFEIPALAALPGGDWLALLDDGLHAPQLARIGRDGSRQLLSEVRRGARLDVAADGRVLVAQPELCDTYGLSYELYRLEGPTLTRLTQLTHCARLRRAVQAGRDIFAVHIDAGRSQLVRLEAASGTARGLLYQPADGTDIVDLAVAPDGRALFAIVRRAGDWRVLQFDLARPEDAPRDVLRHDAPLHNLRYGAAGLEMLAVVDGQQNVWRLHGEQWQALTHSHSAVAAHAGSTVDGALASVVVVAQGYELRWLERALPLHSRAALPARAPLRDDLAAGAAASAAASAPAVAPNAADTGTLGAAVPYLALRSIHPRSWFPNIVLDRGLSAYGASTFGADAAGWHRYLAYAMWESSQRELLGGIQYIFLDRHSFALDRRLAARAWAGPRGDERTTLFDRHLQSQWLSLFPVSGLHGLSRRVHLGLGAAFDRVDRVQVADGSRARLRDERLLAALIDWDSRGSNWYADGTNRGQHLNLLVESYEPFAGRRHAAVPDYDGVVLRAGASAFFGIGRGVLALRATEVRASGRTEPYQLGGATESARVLGTRLNERDLALRGYRGDEPELRARQARRVSIEWRTPLADIDSHGMVPPWGINRLAGTAFVDIGGVWNSGSGSGPDRYRKSVGMELRAETKLLYALSLDLRLGLARALDPVPGGSRTRGYLTLGQAF